MATTPKGIYYPNDYNEIADIPEDMKKMAESIDGVFEDTDSDLSDIKEEQTTQNNRLNSLEVDNTTNKSDILTNKQEINNIKTEQTTQNTNIQNNANAITNLSNRVTETEEDISDIQEEQTTQNTNISTNATNIESLQEENENLKKIVAQMPQVEGQGTEITLENTIEAQFTKFDVEGNSTQETTEGYNMLDLEKYSYSESSSALNGGTVTIKDGVITLNATNATGNMTALSVTKLANADSIEAGTYYFGVDVYGAYESTPSTNIWEYRGNRTLTEKFIMKQWKFAVTQGNIASTPILVSNDTSKTNYEPYTNGASPNPNYEQPIYSAGDNENLFDIDSVTSVIRGHILDENKVIYTNENTSGNFNVIPNFSALELKSTTYFISMDIRRETGSLIFGKINDGNSDWTLVKAPSLSNNYNRYIYKKTYSENTSINKVLIQFVGEGSASIKNIKLEQGNKASGYSPYRMGSINEKIKNADGTEEQDYSIPVQQPMRSIGDVRDCFVKKSDGWYERHYIARKIFDGTEEWGQNGSTASTGQYVIATTDKKYGILNLLSNSFVTKQTSTENSIVGRAINRNIYITIDLSIVEFSVAKFKAYLAEKYASGKSVYVDYELEEPLDLPCTPEQVEQLENKPSTYKDFTTIQSQDETEAYLEVSGVYDLNKLITRTEVLESEV